MLRSILILFVAVFCGVRSAAAAWFQFQTLTHSVTEQANLEPVTYTVILSEPLAVASSVAYRSRSFTGNAANDILPVSGRLEFAAGQTSATFSVTVANDSEVEDAEWLAFELFDAVGAEISYWPRGELRIVDNDSIRCDAVTLWEDAGFADIVVEVTGEVENITYRTENGTAMADVDYTPQSGTLAFTPTERVRSIRIPILNDSIRREYTRSILVVLTTGSQVRYTGVTIRENDFVAIDYGTAFAENGGIGQLIFRRTGEAENCTFSITDRSAIYPRDYGVQSGEIIFAPGATTAIVPIPIFDNPALNGERRFVVRIEQAGEFMGLADVAIVDNEKLLQRDPTFGGDPAIEGTYGHFAAQADGSIIVAGTIQTLNPRARSTIARLTPNGRLDPAFHRQTLLSPLPDQASQEAEVSALAVGPDGMITVAYGFWAQYTNRPSLARFHSDGRPDPTLSFSDVQVIRQSPANRPQINALHIQPDGKLIIGGSFDLVNGIARTNIARLNVDGSVDETFWAGTENTSEHIGPNGPAQSSINCITPLPGGQFMVGGRFSEINGVARMSVAGLNSDGSLDSTFNAGEIQVVQFQNRFYPGNVTSIARQDDGIIYIGGVFDRVQGALRTYARLRSDGALDPSLEIPSFQRGFVVGRGADFFLVAGSCEVGCSSTITKLLPDGSKDPTFHSIESAPFARPEATFVSSDGDLIAGTIRYFGDQTLSRFQARWDEDVWEPFAATLAESDAEVKIRIERFGESDTAATVRYTTVDGTAIQGVDYVRTAGSVTFAPLENVKHIVIPLLTNPSLADFDFRFDLVSSEGGELNRSSVMIGVQNTTFRFRWTGERFVIEGSPGMLVEVEASDDLYTWRTYRRMTPGEAIEVDPSQSAARYYRAYIN